MIWWSGTHGGRPVPGVQQVGNAEHLAAEIAGAGGDVTQALARTLRQVSVSRVGGEPSPIALGRQIVRPGAVE
jgi:hypothetical protein